MRRTVLFCLLAGFLLTAFRFAAPFEGTIRYDVQIKGDAGPLASLMPKYYEFSAKGSDVKLKSDASLVGEILMKTLENKAYLLRRGEKTAYFFDLNSRKLSGNKAKVTKLNATETVAGYTCRKYTVVSKDEDGETVTQTVWAAPDLSVPKPKRAFAIPNAGEFFVEGVEGFPLKMITQSSEFTMTTTASKVEKKQLPASEFVIPSGYTVKDLDFGDWFGE
ncbi:MAG: DUF4412 domain-containing protein [Cytophagales bacterium]|nr:DUF4412 domain-containing protein [Cytophagales bacterium]